MAGWWKKLTTRLRGSPVSPKDYPEFYQTYATAQATAPYDPDRPVPKQRFIVLDAETTGLDVEQAHLVSVGGIEVTGQSIHVGRQFERYLLTPAGEAGAGAIIIHGIIPGSLRYDYSTEPELLAELLEFLAGAVIVGHHIGFDVAMLNRLLAKNGCGPLLNPVVDTAELAKAVLPAGYWSPREAYTLDSMARRYGIPLSDRHTAAGDAYITAVLFLKLTARIAARKHRALALADLRPAVGQ